MSEPRIEVAADGDIAIIGELNHQTVPALLKSGAGRIFNNGATQRDEIAIDLNGVSRSDSAGVALLVEWMRQAKKIQKTIRFHNIPKQMRDIATVTGVDKMLAI